MISDTQSVARAIWRRMPRLRGLMAFDDLKAECDLQAVRGKARSFHQLHCHAIDIARHFGGRRGQYLGEPLSRNLPVAMAPAVERGILIRELIAPLTGQQRRVVLACLEGKRSKEIARDFGLACSSVNQYHSDAIHRMRELV